MKKDYKKLPETVEVDIRDLNIEWLLQYAKKPANQKGAMGKAVYRLAKTIEETIL